MSIAVAQEILSALDIDAKSRWMMRDQVMIRIERGGIQFSPFNGHGRERIAVYKDASGKFTVELFVIQTKTYHYILGQTDMPRKIKRTLTGISIGGIVEAIDSLLFPDGIPEKRAY